MATDASVPPTAALGESIESSETRSSPAQRQGAAEQHDRRANEQATRRRAADVGRHLLDIGWLWRDIADLLHVAGRTLRHWCHELLDRLRLACPLGRPRRRSTRDQRNEVIHFLDEFGPGLGVPTLRECFPTMSRAELDEMHKRYRLVWRERHRVPLRVLHWPVAGRVWAIDYAEAIQPIDDRCPHLLAVRDLATGMQLLWQPVEAASGDNAARSLQSLFATYGPPLVLKSDNGSHFTGSQVQDLLRIHQVECLLSPPHWPRYNGAIEAGIGALKERTEARAARAGHPGYWTWDDTSGALVEANTLPVNATTGLIPEHAWQQRNPIAAAERDAFVTSVQAQLLKQSACEANGNGVWSDREMARKAIRLTLEERGYLHYTRRRILPPIPRPKVARLP